MIYKVTEVIQKLHRSQLNVIYSDKKEYPKLLGTKQKLKVVQKAENTTRKWF